MSEAGELANETHAAPVSCLQQWFELYICRNRASMHGGCPQPRSMTLARLHAPLVGVHMDVTASQQCVHHCRTVSATRDFPSARTRVCVAAFKRPRPITAKQAPCAHATLCKRLVIACVADTLMGSRGEGALL